MRKKKKLSPRIGSQPLNRPICKLRRDAAERTGTATSPPLQERLNNVTPSHRWTWCKAAIVLRSVRTERFGVSWEPGSEEWYGSGVHFAGRCERGDLEEHTDALPYTTGNNSLHEAARRSTTVPGLGEPSRTHTEVARERSGQCRASQGGGAKNILAPSAPRAMTRSKKQLGTALLHLYEGGAESGPNRGAKESAHIEKWSRKKAV
ncbi:hypothetical protein NDU88_009482 [Pleurodeles waltl]|uniref:Uncharacterized protein n=1 Tax=Pleurodeles waltl TaxID=8319 RepID=A0AAV7PVB0_PLEWA|nr:hypothetical protein NDU88_009482 [Pleurodeles waltl]